MTTTDPRDAARVELILAELRLPAIRYLWADLAGQADKEGWPAARFLAASRDSNPDAKCFTSVSIAPFVVAAAQGRITEGLYAMGLTDMPYHPREQGIRLRRFRPGGRHS